MQGGTKWSPTIIFANPTALVKYQDFICNNICNFIRYSKEEDIDDMERDLGDEYGWKQVSLFMDLPKISNKVSLISMTMVVLCNRRGLREAVIYVLAEFVR